MKFRKKRSKARRIFDLILLMLVPIVLYSCSNSIIFQPPACSYEASTHMVTIPVEDDQYVAAYSYPAPEDAFVVLFSHGNAEDIGYLRDHIRRFYVEGFGILAYDYRGYGRSPGKATEQNTYKDIEAAYRYLTAEQHIDPSRIIVHGRSVGSGPSVWLAEKYPVGGLVLESGFVSAYRTRTYWPILPFDKFKNLERIKNVACPVLVIQGKKDWVVGFWHGPKLYDAVKGPKMKYWVENAGHNDLIYQAGEDYWKTLHEFEKLIRCTQEEGRLP